jgi:RHS repeat-associated protein
VSRPGWITPLHNSYRASQLIQKLSGTAYGPVSGGKSNCPISASTTAKTSSKRQIRAARPLPDTRKRKTSTNRLLCCAAERYYQADALGSVTSLSNAGGTLVQSYTYDSFGKQTASSGSLTNPFQYTARESDTETGLYYYRARYYDSQAGRFISEDPLEFGGDTVSISMTT